MSDFILSVFISIGVVTIAMAIVMWWAIRSKHEEEARGK